MVRNNASRRIDMTGKKYGDLEVLGLSDKRGLNNTLLWECKCKCGNVVPILGTSLRAGYYKSCGCKQAEKRDKGVARHIKSDQIEGTRKTALAAKLHIGNKSGHKGVRWYEQRQKWTAHIGFKGKQINLGYFNNLDDAIAARKAGEEKYHKPYLEGNNDE